MLKINVNTMKVDKYLSKLKGRDLETAMEKANAKLILMLKSDTTPHVPRDTGQLLNSWKVDKDSKNRITAGFDEVYAMYQHQGRRANGTHIIRNRPAGGKSFYLKETLENNYQRYMQIYARTVYEYMTGIKI